MNKLYILIFSFFSTGYANAYFQDGITKNDISVNECYQNKTNTDDPDGCVWPPCDDEW